MGGGKIEAHSVTPESLVGSLVSLMSHLLIYLEKYVSEKGDRIRERGKREVICGEKCESDK